MDDDNISADIRNLCTEVARPLEEVGGTVYVPNVGKMLFGSHIHELNIAAYNILLQRAIKEGRIIVDGGNFPRLSIDHPNDRRVEDSLLAGAAYCAFMNNIAAYKDAYQNGRRVKE